MPLKTLVIGYGNELRRDDGIGPFVARAVAALGLPGVVTLAIHQLTPEISAELTCVDRAIFVDASATGDVVGIEAVSPADFRSASAHAGDPARLLGLAKTLYGRCPKAWMVTVPAPDMDFGEGLSAEGRKGADEAVARVRQLLSTW